MNTEAPEMCILFGGYISLPVLLAAHLNEIPILIHEQNARAGKLTRLAFRMGKKILSGWDECSPLDANCFRSVGIPVRKINRLQVFEAWNILHIGSEPPEGPIVVVMGGSLGSRNVFDLVCSAASKDEMKYITFLLVGGKGIVSDSVPKNVVPIAKCWDLEPLISLADAIITRAGASTLSEISVYGLPAVVIPWESAAEGHQVLNAESFIKRNAGCLWQEKDAIDVLIKNIKDMVESRKILSDAEKETRRILINENIWKEMLFTRGREIL